MTYAPDDLKAIQAYCRTQTGQDWAALGIVGDTSHNSDGGYHVGRDVLHALRTAPEDPGGDYSYTESPRDRAGLTDAASAFDLGGNFTRFREVTLGIVAACTRNDPRTRDIREVIYTPDGRNVRRWDALGRRTGGDSSHLAHTHLSFFRDSEGRRADHTNFLGLLIELFEGRRTTSTALSAATEPVEEDTMPFAVNIALPVNVGDTADVTIPPSNLGYFAGFKAYFKLVVDEDTPALYRVALLDGIGGTVDRVSRKGSKDAPYNLVLGKGRRKWESGDIPDGTCLVKMERLPSGDAAADGKPRHLTLCVEYGKA